MARFLGIAASVLSLLAFLCCAAMSFRARRTSDTIWFDPPGAGWSVTPRFKNVDSAILFEWDGDATVGPLPRNSDEAFREDKATIRVPGARFFDHASDTGRGFRVYMAHWLVSLLTAPLPLVALYRWTGRVKRHAKGMCLSCGYDLRESHDRCPECGASVPT